MHTIGFNSCLRNFPDDYQIFLIILSVLVLFNLSAFAREGHEENQSESKNALVLNFGYTHIPQGAELGSESTGGFFVPSIGLDYGRVMGERWEIGIMLDYELDHYLIVEKDLERENAFIVVAGVGYNPIGHGSILKMDRFL